MITSSTPGPFDLLTHVLDAVIVLGIDERIVFWNQAAEKLYDVPHAAALGQKVYKAIGFTDASMSVDQIRNAVREQGFCRGEACHKHRGGREFWVDWTISRCYVGDNQPGYLVITRDITDRKIQERLLKASEENYSRLFHEMLEGFALHEIICDDQGNPVDYRFLAANPAFERMTGLYAADIVGRRVLDALPQTEAHWIEVYGKVALEGEPVFFEEYSASLGKYFEVTAFRPGAGQFACIFSDVTERRKAQNANILNESRLRSLVSIMQHRADNQQDFLDYALEEAIKLSSSAIGYIYHYSEEKREFVLNTWSKEVMHECTVMEQQTIHQLEKTGFWGEVVRQRKPMILNDFRAHSPLKKGYPTGHARLDTFMSLPIFRGDRIIAVVGLANKIGGYDDTDVLQMTLLMDSVFREVERVQGEYDLRKLSLRHDAVLASVPEIIMEVSNDKVYTWANKAGYEFFGNDVIGHEAAEYFEGEQDTYSAVSSLFDGSDQVVYLESWQRRRDGQKRLLAWWCRALRDNNGLVTGALSSARDITEQRQAELERARLEEQLQQAMKMEAVGRLAGGVAHDFNNLLTGITGHVSLALMDLSSTDPLTESLLEVKKAAERATALTGQLLAFSRKQIIEPRVLDLNEIIASLHKMLVRLIGENIHLTTIAGTGIGAVKVDPGQFEQILVNLVVNGRDAMPDGGQLTIKTSNAVLDQEYCRQHPYVRAGNYVQLTVTDTGQGMSDEVKSHLFEPFFTTKPRGRGTGFGLATIYGAVKQAGGSIEVISEEGLGTTVQIFFPQVDELPGKLKEDSGLHQISTGSETILLVEDESIVRDIVLRILDMRGYNVLEAPDAEEALVMAQEYKYPIHLLMTDVVMPGMNGRQLAERVLKIHPEAKVLYSSGYSENQIAHHGIVDEGLNYIGKPFTPDVLAKKLREVLDS